MEFRSAGTLNASSGSETGMHERGAAVRALHVEAGGARGGEENATMRHAFYEKCFPTRMRLERSMTRMDVEGDT